MLVEESEQILVDGRLVERIGPCLGFDILLWFFEAIVLGNSDDALRFLVIPVGTYHLLQTQAKRGPDHIHNQEAVGTFRVVAQQLWTDGGQTKRLDACLGRWPLVRDLFLHFFNVLDPILVQIAHGDTGRIGRQLIDVIGFGSRGKDLDGNLVHVNESLRFSQVDVTNQELGSCVIIQRRKHTEPRLARVHGGEMFAIGLDGYSFQETLALLLTHRSQKHSARNCKMPVRDSRFRRRHNRPGTILLVLDRYREQ